MAGFMDILGTMIQQGMSQSSGFRMSKGLGAGSGSASLNDLMGSLSQMMGGGQVGKTAQAGLGGVLGGVFGSLGNNKAALGGLGALARALLGGGKSSARGAVGGGGLAILHPLPWLLYENLDSLLLRLQEHLWKQKHPRLSRVWKMMLK